MILDKNINIKNTFEIVEFKNKKQNEILQKVTTINSSFFLNINNFREDFKKINATELNEILNNLFLDKIDKEEIKNPIECLKRLALVLPLDKLEEASKSHIESFTSALEEAKDRLEESKIYFEATTPPSPTFRSKLSSLLESMISIIECLIATFGVGDFFKPAEGVLEAEMKSHKLLMLISLFSTISAAVLPLMNPTTGMLILGGTIFFIIALSIIWPYIKPINNHLPSGENWSKKFSQGIVAEGRRDSLNEIANILKTKQHPILIGPSTVGKSYTAAAFTQEVVNGVYPELKGKVIFRFNTEDFLRQRKGQELEGGGNLINKVYREMGRHSNDFILILDELHMACKKDGEISNQLKTFLEPGGAFPHVIGITTDIEYEEYIKADQAFSERFQPVEIKNTNKEETIQILSNLALNSCFKPLLEEDALDLIYQESDKTTENAPQPTTAIKLLKRCINRTTKTQKSPTEEKINKLSTALKSLQSQRAATQGRKKIVTFGDSKDRKTIKDVSNDLRQEINKLQKIYSEEKKETDKLFRNKELLDLVIKEIYSSIDRINKITRTMLTTSDENELKMFLLLQGYLSPYLEKYLKKQTESINKKTTLIEEKEDDIKNNEVKEAKPIKINLFIDKSIIEEEAELLKLSKQKKDKPL